MSSTSSRSELSEASAALAAVCGVCGICGVCGVCGICGVCGVCGSTSESPPSSSPSIASKLGCRTGPFTGSPGEGGSLLGPAGVGTGPPSRASSISRREATVVICSE